jgi:hypothetical protein
MVRLEKKICLLIWCFKFLAFKVIKAKRPEGTTSFLMESYFKSRKERN